MTNMHYLANATNEAYSKLSIDYLVLQKTNIETASSATGISVGAIAGAMAEESRV